MIVFSTVYLSYHYVIDVVAGATFAAVMLSVSPRLERVLARLGEPSPDLRGAHAAE
jgi:membrane-associated phospholipid phosphatase